MVAADVFHALPLEQGYAFRVGNELFQGVDHAVIVGQDVDYRAQLVLPKDAIALLLAAADADESARHGFKRVHRRGIAVQLVKYGIATIHHADILGKGNRLGDAKLYPVGMVFLHVLRRTEHDVRALVFAAFAVYANEQPQFVAAGRHGSTNGSCLYGKRDELCLLRKSVLVAHKIFI